MSSRFPIPVRTMNYPFTLYISSLNSSIHFLTVSSVFGEGRIFPGFIVLRSSFPISNISSGFSFCQSLNVSRWIRFTADDSVNVLSNCSCNSFCYQCAPRGYNMIYQFNISVSSLRFVHSA